jgi:hypothetical protein
VAVLLVVFAFLGIFIVAIVFAARAATRQANNRAIAPGGPLAEIVGELGVPQKGLYAFTRHERSFSAKYFAGAKNSPPSLTITTPVDEIGDASSGTAYRETARPHLAMRPAITLRQETSFDRWGKRIGLNREVQTGDADLDGAVYIETDAPDADVNTTFADESFRAAVRALLQAGSTRIELGPTGLSAVIVFTLRQRVISREGFEKSTALLAQAAATLPLFKAGQVGKRRAAWPPVVALMLGATSPVLFLGIAGNAPIDHTPRRIGILGGLALWALLTLLLGRLMRGRSDSLRRVALFSFGLLIAVPFGLYGAIAWTNRSLDTSPAVDHTTTITRVWSERHKNSTSFYVEVASWRPGEETVQLSVSSTFASNANPGLGIVVTTHAGHLGWEWVDTFHLTGKRAH